MDVLDLNDTGSDEQEGAPPPDSSNVTVVQIAGKKFVSGLLWQPLTRPRAYMKEAREIGKREKMEVVTIRRRRVLQAGFAPRGRGVGNGMYSLASALTLRLGNSFIGAFHIEDDTYAFLAVADDSIIPRSDLIGTREEVMNRLRYFYGMDTWARVIGPEGFDFCNEEIDIHALLAPSALSRADWKSVRLQPLTFGMTPADAARYGVIAAIVLGGAFGYFKYKQITEQRAREAKIRAEVAKRAELERIQAQTRKDQMVKALEHPWIKMPAVEDYIFSCGRRINALPLSLSGWGFDSAKCENNTVIARYRRHGTATLNALIEGAMAEFKVTPTFTDEYEAATIKINYQVELGGDDALRPADEMLASVVSYFQALGIKPKIAEQVVAQPPQPQQLPGQTPNPNAPKVEPPPVPNWKTYTFSFDTELAPEIIFSGSQWAGMRITKYQAEMKQDAAQLKWIIGGEFYGSK